MTILDEEEQDRLTSTTQTRAAGAGAGADGTSSGSAPAPLSNQLERLSSYSGRSGLKHIACTRKKTLSCVALLLILAVLAAVTLFAPQTDEELAETDAENELFTADLPSDDDQKYGPKQECDPNAPRPPKDSKDYAVLAADCGLGYDYKNSTSKDKPWHVVLYGHSWFATSTLKLSGCPIGTGLCPFSPLCSFTRTQDDLAAAKKGDVVMMFQHDYKLVDGLMAHPPKKKQYRVLYYREAFWTYPPKPDQKKFDFQMGVHWQSGIWNPDFAFVPARLFTGLNNYGFDKIPIPILKAEERSNFALSIISHCNAWSKRDLYIDGLIETLGKHRVHRYGKCGDRTLPPPPITNAVKVISKYKFYLSFENMIQDGYMTEKVLAVLTMPIVPVYYGGRALPNITLTPSYIKASDFHTPQKLAKYLLHLDQNPAEYDKYHEWRTSKYSIHPQFLELLAMKKPGYYEIDAINKVDATRTEKRRGSRAAACCRLCDENHIKWIMEQPRTLYDAPLYGNQILHDFFGRKFHN